jgi:nucleoside-diphosphate-sugar epimerase
MIVQGYDVRAAVRSKAKGETIKSNPTLRGVSSSQLSFITVPDFLAPGAFDKAVKGVKYIVHLASPIPFRDGADPADQEEHFVKPAIRGTISILESARKAGTVKRVVITSSLVVNVPIEVQFGVTPATEAYTAESRIHMPQTPYPNAFVAYIASKVGALAEAEAWVAANKSAASFDVIHVHPSYTIGRDDTALTSKDVNEGVNSTMFSTIMGVETDQVKPGNTVHVDDAARVHALALDPDVPGNQSFLTVSGGLTGTKWQDSLEIVAKHFPEAVADGSLPNDGTAPTVEPHVVTDASKTEETFGFVHKNYEEQVTSVVSHYLELVNKGL